MPLLMFKAIIVILALAMKTQALESPGDSEISESSSNEQHADNRTFIIQQTDLLQFDDCPLENSTENCGTIYTTVTNKQTKDCSSPNSLNRLMKHFFPNLDIKDLLGNIFEPEKFDCTRFYVNTCKTHIEFQAESREDIDLVPNRLRIEDARLLLRVSYKAPILYYGTISFEMTGKVYLDSRNMQVTCSKDFDNAPISITLDVKQFTIQELERLFLVSAFDAKSLPPALADLKAISLSSAQVNGYYYSDGYFEFIMQGKAETATIFSSSTFYLIIQKRAEDEIAIGVVVHFPSALFRETLSTILGQDFPNEIPILWYSKSEMVLHLSRTGIQKVKNADFNRIFRFFMAGRMAVIKGLTLSVAFPFQQFVNVKFPSLKKTYLPISFLFIASIRKHRVRISFETDISLSLDDALLVFTSGTKFHGQLADIFDSSSTTRVRWMDLLLQQFEIQISLSLTNAVNVIKGYPQLSHFDIFLAKKLRLGWKLRGTGIGRIASTEFRTVLKELSSGKYCILGKANLIYTGTLIKTFAEYSGLAEIQKQFSFVNFKLRDVFIYSNVERRLNFRLTGKPDIIDSADGEYSELLLYNSTRSYPGFALGLLIKGISFEVLLAKMFGERQQRPSWVRSVDCAMMISNENQNGGSLQLAFKFSELNRFVLKRGISIGLTIYLTSGCREDGLCKLLETQMLSASMSVIYLQGTVNQNGMDVAWKTKSIQLSSYIELTDVVFRISGSLKLSYLLETTMSLNIYGLSLKGIISSDVSCGLSLNMHLGATWHRPFVVEGFMFEDMSFKATQASLTDVEFLEMEARVYVGTVHTQRRLSGNAIITIHMTNQQQSYFYSKLQSLDLSYLLEAFQIQSQLPLVLQQAKFLGAAILGYSNNPLSFVIDDLNLKLENRLTIRGMMTIWGFVGQYYIAISEGRLILEVSLPYLSMDNGYVKMSSICDCPERKKFDGPALIAEFYKSSVNVRLYGKVRCLGIMQEANVTIESSGYSFMLSGSIYEVIEGDLLLAADYGDPFVISFTVKGCIAKAIPNVTYEVMVLLKEIRDDTKEFLHSTRTRINELGEILEQSHNRMNIQNEKALSYKSKIEEEISSLAESQEQPSPCLDDCSKECMGVPSWLEDALSFNGYSVGSPKWKQCAHQVSDINCVVRCLGHRVIRNVKAFNSQRKLQGLLNAYERSTESKKLSRGFLQKAVYIVGGMIKKLEKVDDQLAIGMSIVKAMLGNKFMELVSVDEVCIKGSLREAVESQVRFSMKGKLFGRTVEAERVTAIDLNIWKKLAVTMVEKMFPNATSFKGDKKRLQQLLKDIDTEKEGVLSELDSNIRRNEIETFSRKNIVTEEENKLRQFAFKELPRYTLGSDRVVQLFNKDSPWVLIQGNDPLESAFNNKTTILQENQRNSSYGTEQGTKKSACASAHDIIKDYANLLGVTSGLAENFFEEKISYLKSRNKKLAGLRDIEDQIKSDCYLENCTIGQMNDALRYAGKAKSGFIKWMEEVKRQLRKHDQFALQVAIKDVESVINKERRMSLKEYIKSMSSDFSQSFKRTLKKHHTGFSQLDQLDLDLKDILLNSRNKRVTSTAPLIFSMKKRFKYIKRKVANECARK